MTRRRHTATTTTTTPAPAPTTTVVPGAALSGVYLGGVRAAAADEFGVWRGRRVDVLHTFPYRGTWDAIEQCGDAVLAQGTGYTGERLMLSVGMLPNSGGTLAEGAAGAYDSHWAAHARTLVAAGSGSCWWRTGWEFNQDFPAWTINTGQVVEFRDYFRRIVNVMRDNGFTGRPIWCPAAGTNASRPDPVLAYPGDDVVAAIMPDQYDHWWNHPAGTVTPAARWNNLLYGLNAPDGTPRGLAYWSAFAQAHGKVYGFAEWGLWNVGTMQGGGGDDPLYITQVGAHLAAVRAAGTTTLECYFNADATDGAHKIHPTGTADFTLAAAQYQTTFRAL